MKLPSDISGWALTIVAILFSLGAAFSLTQMQTLKTQVDSGVVAQGIWAVSQGEGRFLNAQIALRDFITDPSEENREKTIEQIDFLWNRYHVLSRGRIQLIASAYPKYDEAMSLFRASLEKVDSQIEPLTPDSARTIIEILAPLKQHLHQLLISASLTANKERANEINEAQEIISVLMIAFVVILIAGFAALLLLSRENRRFRREVEHRSKAEAQLQEAKEIAERANASKSQFLATVSHEFRTPLNAILGFSDMLRSQFFGPLGSPKYREYADAVHASGTHLLSLIDDVLDITTIEAGKRPLDREAVDIADTFGKLRATFELSAREAGVALKQRVDADLPPAFVDRRALRQILQNLISNALKFTEPGGTITLGATRAHGAIELRVTDTGVGIPREQIERVTEPFFTSDGGADEARKGTGLGLAIVVSLVGVHGGHLHIDSALGRGTSVIIRFPENATVPLERVPGNSIPA